MCNTIEYVSRESKAYKIEYNLCSITDSPESITDDFHTTRIAFNKDSKILGHQLVQSFSDYDNITPEKAHQIGIELMNKTLSEYQVVMATHTDGKYIHNHFIINSVSPLDGMKFSDNKTKVNMIRRVSDELCHKHNLTVVNDDVAKYIGLDASTLNLAKRGKSWKVDLVKSLDTAFENCKSKDEFIEFLKSENFEVKVTDKNITFKKLGESKGIRTDTLAKQFGVKYSKRAIDERFNKSDNTKSTSNTYTPKNKKSVTQIRNEYNKAAQREWRRYEKKYKNKYKIKNDYFLSSLAYSRNPIEFTFKLFIYLFCINATVTSKPSKLNGNKLKIKSRTYGQTKQYISNIPMKTIVNSPGDTVQVKLYSWQIAKILDNQILCSAKLDITKGTGIVTLKAFDIERVAKVLNISKDTFANQIQNIRNKTIKYDFNKSKKKLSYLVLTKSQVELLSFNCVKFIQYPKDDKFNVGFDLNDKEKILSILYPNRKENSNNKDTFFKRNAELNAKLKNQSNNTGERLCYKIVSSNEYKALRETEIEYAVFRQKDGNYNVVFLEHNRQEINKLLKGVKNNANINNKTTPKTPKLKV